MRAREIDRWAQSEQFRALLAANQQPAGGTSSGSTQQRPAQRKPVQSGGTRIIPVQ